MGEKLTLAYGKRLHKLKRICIDLDLKYKTRLVHRTGTYSEVFEVEFPKEGWRQVARADDVYTDKVSYHVDMNLANDIAISAREVGPEDAPLSKELLHIVSDMVTRYPLHERRTRAIARRMITMGMRTPAIAEFIKTMGRLAQEGFTFR